MRTKIACLFAGLLTALSPLLMAPSGGLPSVASFQAVQVKRAATATNPTPTRPPLYLNSARPLLAFNETDQAANNRYWSLQAHDGDFRIDLTSDDGLTVATALNFERSGAASSVLSFGNATDNPAINFLGNGRFAVNNVVSEIRHATPQFLIEETDASLNNKVWAYVAAAETLRFGAESDDHLSTTNWMTVDRTGTTVDTINLAATAITTNGVNATFATAQAGANVTGCTTNPGAVVRLRKHGVVVTAQIDGVSCTSNATTFTLTSAIPAGYQATRDQCFPVRAGDNSAQVAGAFVCTGIAGTLTYGTLSGTSGWTAAGTKSTSSTAITYITD